MVLVVLSTVKFAVVLSRWERISFWGEHVVLLPPDREVVMVPSTENCFGSVCKETVLVLSRSLCCGSVKRERVVVLFMTSLMLVCL